MSHSSAPRGVGQQAAGGRASRGKPFGGVASGPAPERAARAGALAAHLRSGLPPWHSGCHGGLGTVFSPGASGHRNPCPL